MTLDEILTRAGPPPADMWLDAAGWFDEGGRGVHVVYGDAVIPVTMTHDGLWGASIGLTVAEPDPWSAVRATCPDWVAERAKTLTRAERQAARERVPLADLAAKIGPVPAGWSATWIARTNWYEAAVQLTQVSDPDDEGMMFLPTTVEVMLDRRGKGWQHHVSWQAGLERAHIPTPYRPTAAEAAAAGMEAAAEAMAAMAATLRGAP